MNKKIGSASQTLLFLLFSIFQQSLHAGYSAFADYFPLNEIGGRSKNFVEKDFLPFS